MGFQGKSCDQQSDCHLMISSSLLSEKLNSMQVQKGEGNRQPVAGDPESTPNPLLDLQFAGYRNKTASSTH